MTTLLFFAAIREAAGTSSWRAEATTVGEALKRACEQFGDRFEAILATCSILHREETVKREEWWNRAVDPGDEIAVLPPVSGGQEHDPDRRDNTEFRMVDVGDKEETKREATAVCVLTCSTVETRDRLLTGGVKKGDAVAPAKVAGILAAKRVPDLIPLCHPVRTTSIDVDVAPHADTAIEVRATVRGRDRTGFEIEALTAASVAALTLYDFAKAEDPRMRIGELRVVAKSGGKSGSVTFE